MIPELVWHVATTFADTDGSGVVPTEVVITPNALAVPEFITIEAKECFRNAALLVLSGVAERYALGVAWTDDLPIPIEHCWVITAQGEHADPTYQNFCANRQFRYLLVVDIGREELEEHITQPPRFYPPLMHHIIKKKRKAA